jgi:hypothetical protein
MIFLRALSKDMLSLVILGDQIQPKLLDEVEHEGVVFANPSGSAFYWAVFYFLQPFKITFRAILHSFTKSQRTNATSYPL